MADAHPDWIPAYEGEVHEVADVVTVTRAYAEPLEFRPMLAGDALLLELQDSQRFELGFHHQHFTIETGRDLAYSEGSIAWTAHRGTTVVAIAGLRQVMKGQAIAWAALSGAVGTDHLAITRKTVAVIAEAIADGTYHRIEAIVEADNERAITWAMRVGLEHGYVLRAYGPEAKPHILFEKVSDR